MDAIFYGIARACEGYLFPAMSWLGNAPNALLLIAGLAGFAIWVALLAKFRSDSRKSGNLE